MVGKNTKGDKATVNALATIETNSEFGLVGPTAEDDIQRAINRYGADAVKEAVAKLTKKKRGRTSKMDWRKIRHLLEEDAESWLSGGDPFSERSNYSIEKYYADNFPGQSHPSTMKMVHRHLKKSRVWITLATAEGLSRDRFSYKRHIQALQALGEAWDWSDYVMDKFALEEVQRYETIYGSAPEEAMTMEDVKEAVRNPPPSPARQINSLLGCYLEGGSD